MRSTQQTSCGVEGMPVLRGVVYATFFHFSSQALWKEPGPSDQLFSVDSGEHIVRLTFSHPEMSSRCASGCTKPYGFFLRSFAASICIIHMRRVL